MLSELKRELGKHKDPERAKGSARFFKTGKGEYGFGDVFVGIKVPDLRKLAKKYQNIPLEDVVRLLKSKIHEERLLAILFLIDKYRQGDEKLKKKIFEIYIKSTKYINNWDLIDISAEHVVGAYLANKPNDLLFEFTKSKDLWKRRIAIMATFHGVKKGECAETLEIAELLLTDKHDLIQKAAGWMLREVGKRCSLDALEAFLKEHYESMPRTMLRYAIEKFPEAKRQKYLKGKM